MPTKVFFVTNVLYNCISQIKISCTNVWRRNSLWEIVTQTIWNSFGTFDHVSLTFDPVTPKSIGFLCYPGRTCVWGPSLRKVGQVVLQLLIGNKKVTDGRIDMCKAICPLFFEVHVFDLGYEDMRRWNKCVDWLPPRLQYT